jgi:hypothetical protein
LHLKRPQVLNTIEAFEIPPAIRGALEDLRGDCGAEPGVQLAA